MELVADNNLEIVCSLGKVNLVVYVLSYRKANVSVEKEIGGFISMLEMLRVNVLIDKLVYFGEVVVN